MPKQARDLPMLDIQINAIHSGLAAEFLSQTTNADRRLNTRGLPLEKWTFVGHFRLIRTIVNLLGKPVTNCERKVERLRNSVLPYSCLTNNKSGFKAI